MKLKLKNTKIHFKSLLGFIAAQCLYNTLKDWHSVSLPYNYSIYKMLRTSAWRGVFYDFHVTWLNIWKPHIHKKGLVILPGFLAVPRKAEWTHGFVWRMRLCHPRKLPAQNKSKVWLGLFAMWQNIHAVVKELMETSNLKTDLPKNPH